ncbi:3-hydroxyacyl-CoA dehydrogenase family protein [Nonomuraea wenchangensis]|uniref:3-hydroxyacyl-CoA dehydrogenase family protein n=1 Tax=Nonomuraea wenchangensis TaxID=568860 RepID=UPI001C42F0F7
MPIQAASRLTPPPSQTFVQRCPWALTQGYILNSLLVPLLLAAGKLWVNGVATPETIDAAWRVASQSPFGPLSDPRRQSASRPRITSRPVRRTRPSRRSPPR